MGMMTKVVTLPSRVEIERDWNEKANDYQDHGAYHQAKSQLQNYRRSSLERLERDCDRPPNPVTEEAIQVGAKAIHDKKVSPKPDLQMRQVRQLQRQRIEQKKKEKQNA
jgi:hypothetical protein